MKKDKIKGTINAYEGLFSCKNSFDKEIELYIVKNNLTLNDSYYISKKWLNELLEKAYKNEDCLREISTYFLLHPTTLYLREILEKWCDYNAMCLIDSVQCQIPKLWG